MSGLVWQLRQASSAIFSGRARYSERPVGVSRTPETSLSGPPLRKGFRMSLSQSTALLRGLVGLNDASLCEESGYLFLSRCMLPVAANAGPLSGRNLSGSLGSSGRTLPTV